MENWLFEQGGKPSVPHTSAQIQAKIADGSLSPDVLVWTTGMAQWAPARSFPQLLPGGVAIPPPLPRVPLAYMPPTPPPGSDAAMRLLIPVGRSGWAIAAGYCGLFALIPLFAPIAIIVSIVALRDLKKHPESHGKGRAIFGLVMGLLFTFGPIILIAVSVMNG